MDFENLDFSKMTQNVNLDPLNLPTSSDTEPKLFLFDGVSYRVRYLVNPDPENPYPFYTLQRHQIPGVGSRLCTGETCPICKVNKERLEAIKQSIRWRFYPKTTVLSWVHLINSNGLEEPPKPGSICLLCGSHTYGTSLDATLLPLIEENPTRAQKFRESLNPKKQGKVLVNIAQVSRSCSFSLITDEVAPPIAELPEYYVPLNKAWAGLYEEIDIDLYTEILLEVEALGEIPKEPEAVKRRKEQEEPKEVSSSNEKKQEEKPPWDGDTGDDVPLETGGGKEEEIELPKCFGNFEMKPKCMTCSSMVNCKAVTEDKAK